MSQRTVCVCLFTLAASACASGASLSRTDELAGNVRLHGAYMPSMAAARELIAEHCGGRFSLQEHDRALHFRCLTESPVRLSAR